MQECHASVACSSFHVSYSSVLFRIAVFYGGALRLMRNDARSFQQPVTY